MTGIDPRVDLRPRPRRLPAMTLTQLRYLVAIADAELNITLAASRVHADDAPE